MNKTNIHSILVDDEEKSLSSLQNLIKKYAPQVVVEGTASSVKDAVKKINELKPDLVFLDINMPDGNGFDVVDMVSYSGFELIFVTAFDKYAIRAFELSAIHYLLKPINYKELQKAIDRYELIKSEAVKEERLNILKENFERQPQKIILPSLEGLNVVDIDSIVRCEADSNYTVFYLENGNKEIISKSLNNFDKLLCDHHFSRIHSKHLINLKFLKRYVKGKAGYVIMNDNQHVYISETRKKSFVDDLNHFAKSI